jgi:hypothetical protein
MPYERVGMRGLPPHVSTVLHNMVSHSHGLRNVNQLHSHSFKRSCWAQSVSQVTATARRLKLESEELKTAENGCVEHVNSKDNSLEDLVMITCISTAVQAERRYAKTARARAPLASENAEWQSRQNPISEHQLFYTTYFNDISPTFTIYILQAIAVIESATESTPEESNRACSPNFRLLNWNFE